MVTWTPQRLDTSMSAASGRAWVVAAALVCGLQLSACGSKTGLDVPDVGVPTEPPPPCIELPSDPLANVTIDLSTNAELRRADVFFLIDNSRSMEGEIAQIRARLRDRLAPAIFEQIPDTHFGVGTVADFPIEPYGERGDVPYALSRQLTGDLATVQGAVDLIRLTSGGDIREAQIEAVYQVATGAGLGDHIPASFGCPSGGFGGVCFREDAFPVILLFTDAPMHGGPATGDAYDSRVSPTPHSYLEMIDALRERGIRVLGLWSNVNDAERNDLEAMVRDSGGLDSNGAPLVFNIGSNGERLGTGVAGVLREFARSIIFNIGAIAVDPTPDDGVNVTRFVESITPLRAEPMSGVDRINPIEETFEGVVSGTRVIFQVTLHRDSVVPGPTAQRFRLQVDFRTGGSTFIGTGEVDLVIPGLDGTGCESFGTGTQ